MEEILVQIIKPLIEALAGHYGKIAQAVAIASTFMGFVRIMFKPLMVALHELAANTSSSKDNELLEKVESSKAFKIFSFIMDYVLSIKVPEKK